MGINKTSTGEFVALSYQSQTLSIRNLSHLLKMETSPPPKSSDKTPEPPRPIVPHLPLISPITAPSPHPTRSQSEPCNSMRSASMHIPMSSPHQYVVCGACTTTPLVEPHTIAQSQSQSQSYIPLHLHIPQEQNTIALMCQFLRGLLHDSSRPWYRGRPTTTTDCYF